MKTALKGQILSAAVFALAIAGAVSGNAMTKRKSLTIMTGHERISGNPNNCQARIDCSVEDTGNPCTYLSPATVAPAYQG